ncbi:hypothetical protein SDC9_144294 [bioreactor metagenome]|uniref:Uncharacterized protein n=1 Tax=bioreactor metagenome TaxID=1076179 RepID=A0A645E6D8_9ZZZZ
MRTGVALDVEADLGQGAPDRRDGGEHGSGEDGQRSPGQADGERNAEQFAALGVADDDTPCVGVGVELLDGEDQLVAGDLDLFDERTSGSVHVGTLPAGRRAGPAPDHGISEPG